MGARQAVLLTPSKSSYPDPLPFNKHPAPVSSLFATPTKSTHLYHSTAFTHPLFSYSYALFCQNRGVWGGLHLFPQWIITMPHSSLPPHFQLSTPSASLPRLSRPCREASPGHQSRVTSHLLVESGQKPFKEFPHV